MPFPYLLRWFWVVFMLVMWAQALGLTPSCEDRIRLFASHSGEALVRVDAGGWDSEADQEVGATVTVMRFNASNNCYEKASAFPLRSEWLPAQVVLTDRAEFIVALGNVETRSGGSDAIVVYRPDGSVVKRWSLLEVVNAAGRMQIDFEGGLRWAGNAILRGSADSGFVQIWLLDDRANKGGKQPQLRLDLSSMTLVAEAGS